MRRVTAGLLTAVLLGFPALVSAADFTGVVLGITHGDTIDVLDNSYPKRIPLNGLDAPPEKGQPLRGPANTGAATKRLFSIHPVLPCALCLPCSRDDSGCNNVYSVGTHVPQYE